MSTTKRPGFSGCASSASDPRPPSDASTPPATAASAFSSNSASPAQGDAASLDVDRLVVYVNEKEGGNWTGISLLRPNKYWLLKDRLLRVQAVTVERNGTGIPVYKSSPVPEGIAYDQQKARMHLEAEISAGEDIALNLRSGETAGASIPAGADLKLLGVTGSLPRGHRYLLL